MIEEGKTTLGGCDKWLCGTGSGLSTRFYSERVTNVSLVTYDANSGVRTLKTCNDGDSAPLILEAIAEATAVKKTVPCVSMGEVHGWSTMICNDRKTAFCVDCDDPCSTDQCVDLESLRPCGKKKGNTYACDEADSRVNAYRILSGMFVPLSPVPTIYNISTTSTKKTISVTVKLRGDAGSAVEGTVNCATFVPTVTPTSTASILLQDWVASTIDGIAVVEITGLYPATQYDIYCTAMSPLGSATLLPAVLHTKMPTLTKCCKIVSVALSIRSLYLGTSSLDAVSVTLDAPPSASVSVTVTTQSSSGTQSLVPSRAEFSSSLLILQKSLSIVTASTVDLGLVTVIVTLTGLSASEYEVDSSNARNFTVFSFDVPPAVPQLVSIRFSDDGMHLVATFDSPTDKALVTACEFPCSKLFQFPNVNSATCSWTSSSAVEMALGGRATILPGDTVVFLGGQGSALKVRAVCLTTPSRCLTYDFSPEGSYPVLAPLDPSRPVVGISAISVIGKCDPYKIDISASTGNLGRPFKSVRFTVTSAGDSSKAENALNRLFSLSPPTRVPYGTFPPGQVSSIAVTLCNFFDRCSTSSVLLTVTGRYLHPSSYHVSLRYASVLSLPATHYHIGVRIAIKRPKLSSRYIQLPHVNLIALLSHILSRLTLSCSPFIILNAKSLPTSPHFSSPLLSSALLQ